MSDTLACRADDVDMPNPNIGWEQERQANSFAAKLLIPPQFLAAADWPRLVRDHAIVDAEAFEPGAIEVETWTYAPGALTNDNAVDPLSRHLSLRGCRDERVAMAAAALLEAMPW